jgi:hypothetical protein
MIHLQPIMSRLGLLLPDAVRVLGVEAAVNEGRDHRLGREYPRVLRRGRLDDRIYGQGHDDGFAPAQRDNRGISLDRGHRHGLPKHLQAEVELAPSSIRRRG